MKIERIELFVVEIPDSQSHVYELIQVPGVSRIQYTHRAKATAGPQRDLIMRVTTDDGVQGYCTVDGNVGDMSVNMALLRANVLGEDPLAREHIFQKLHLGTRWMYRNPGWFGALDNCLWDIAGIVAGLPVYKLLGQVRAGLPAYQTAGDGPVEMYIEHIEQGKDLGIQAYKPHSYKGGKADIPIMRKLRQHVGPDYALMLDPVCSYTLREAIEVGHVLEELNFVWLEEPFHEQKMHQYQTLCAALTIPIMANEMLMHDMLLSAEWIIQGASDLMRANARHGATQVLKMAHFCELYGTNIELNGVGGLYGLLHAHLGCAIANTGYYEHSLGGGRLQAGPAIGMTTPAKLVDGCLVPPDRPGWGAIWDEQQLQACTVQVL